MDKKALCVDALVAGSVQTFVDLFHLTHREASSLDGAADAEVPELEAVKARLEEAELARRRRDMAAALRAYQVLASFFGAEVGDHRTAVYFWEKCAEAAGEADDASALMAAIRAQGVGHEALGQYDSALSLYQNLQWLAAEASDAGQQAVAWSHLHVVNATLATIAATNGDLHGALALRQTCLRAAEAAGDAAVLASAHYELGKARHAPLFAMAGIDVEPEVCTPRRHTKRWARRRTCLRRSPSTSPAWPLPPREATGSCRARRALRLRRRTNVSAQSSARRDIWNAFLK
mmetsp:Transcript_3195/g.9359  ORF Transcript_3195/g.9359 Transcript_3195/m.9359 type:complete len:290 (-) Transcript_3195:460-1329(-)